MPKYLDPAGTSFLWKQIKNITQRNLIYYSKTTEEWNSDVSLLAEENVLYIYTDHKVIIKDGEQMLLPGLKFGDGKTYLIDLPFLNDSQTDQAFIDHMNNNIIHVSAADRQFWDNKLNFQLENENLILNRQ